MTATPKHFFAKLFTVGEYQLVVYLDQDDEIFTLHQLTDLGDALLDIELSGPEVAMRKIFERYEQETAERVFTSSVVVATTQAMAERHE